MIMISRPEFAALRRHRPRGEAVPGPLGDWHGPTWPVNEVVLGSLLGGGRSVADIARLFDVEPAVVTQLRTRFGI